MAPGISSHAKIFKLIFFDKLAPIFFLENLKMGKIWDDCVKLTDLMQSVIVFQFCSKLVQVIFDLIVAVYFNLVLQLGLNGIYGWNMFYKLF